MRPLRTQVDKIDRKILRLLQQRIELSRHIGAVKRRHGAPVYVPEREREVLRKVALLSRGQLSPRAARAIFREILSSSRAEQRQPPLGLLRASADVVLPAARWSFGACDHFERRATWGDLARGLMDGSLAIALVSGADLTRILAVPGNRDDFRDCFFVAGELPLAEEAKPGLAGRVFMVTRRRAGMTGSGDHMLFLIECKSPGDKVKRWLESMTAPSFHVEQVTPAKAGRSRHFLVRAAGRTAGRAAKHLTSAGVPFAIVGVYQATEDDAG
jgi:chorismate mutase